MSAAPPMPVVWLFGPPGVGKTTVAWALFRAWSAEGTPTGYVDIDQLGMLYPAADPRNHVVKARNLAAVLRSFEAAGVRRTVVSGVLDPDEMADFAARCGGGSWVWCRLTATRDEVRHRLVRHRSQPEMVEDAAAHAELLDREDLADVRIDTTGRSVQEVLAALRDALAARSPGTPSRVRPVREHEDDADAGTGDAAAVRPTPARPAIAIAVTGSRAVGKSTVAWEVFQRVQREGRTAAYIDLEQVSFVGGAASAAADDAVRGAVRLSNVAAMARNFGEAGAEVLVLSGAVTDGEQLRAYSAGLAPARLTVVRLLADERTVRERVAHRAVQRAMHLPGDDLRALPAEDQAAVVRGSLRTAATPAAAGLGHPLDTSGRAVEEIAADILALVRRDASA